jgi:hypothetical protein
MNIIGQAKSEKKLRKSSQAHSECSITTGTTAKVSGSTLHFVNSSGTPMDQRFALKNPAKRSSNPCAIAI